jgi:hypothetical protein
MTVDVGIRLARFLLWLSSYRSVSSTISSEMISCVGGKNGSASGAGVGWVCGEDAHLDDVCGGAYARA